jgi:hypothetical protein
MLIAIATLLAAAQAAPPETAPSLGHTAWIVATVNHSEFCPAGNVRLDLITGRYQFTAGLLRGPACDNSALDRPTRTGVLSPLHLAPIRAAFARALVEDVQTESCRFGRTAPAEEVVVSNGGTPVLVLTTGSFTLSAPGDLSCWSRAANALHQLLDRAFPSRLPR